MNHEISTKRIEEMVGKLKQGFGIVSLIPRTLKEKEALVRTVVEREDADLAIKIISHFHIAVREEDPTPEELAPEEVERLKHIILKTKDVDIACPALLNLRAAFTKDELIVLRKLAYTTKNEYWAYHIYRNDCIALTREAGSRAALRRVVVSTKNPERAFEFLREQEENREAYDDDAKSMEYTNDEVEQFKRVIISSHDPQWSFHLLRTAEPKDPEDFTREDEGPVEVTPKERASLKRNIIESQSPEWAYDTLRRISDLTQGERMVLKGIFMRIQKPSIACHALCDTDFISSLNENERAHLLKLAVKVKEPYQAREALKYIYDLTSEERATLEKVAQQKHSVSND